MPATATEFEDLERLVAAGVTAAELFGADLEAGIRRLRVVTHPDRNPDRRDRATALAAAIGRLADEARRPPTVVRSPKREYRLAGLVGVGDVADVHQAIGDGHDYAFKVTRIPAGVGLLEVERQALTCLLGAARAGTYSRYLPTLVESFPVRDRVAKRANVFTLDPGWYTLERVMARHPDLDGRHVAWVFKRLTTVIGFAHLQGWVHAAVTPAHVLVHPESHGLRLVGWGHAVQRGGVVTSAPARYLAAFPPEIRDKRPATPATDIHQAATTAAALGTAESVPPPIRRFFAGCTMDSPGMRPGDAWALQDEFADLLARVYGPPAFAHLEMP